MYKDYDDRLPILYLTSGYDYDKDKIKALNIIAKNAYTYLMYLDTLISSSTIKDVYVPIFFALEQSFYIECSKLFDTSTKGSEPDKTSKIRNIDTFITHLDNREKEEHEKNRYNLDEYEDLYWKKQRDFFNPIIKSICGRRDKYYAHNNFCDISKFNSKYKIESEDKVKELLKFCIDITDFWKCTLPHKSTYYYENYLRFDNLYSI